MVGLTGSQTNHNLNEKRFDTDLRYLEEDSLYRVDFRERKIVS